MQIKVQGWLSSLKGGRFHLPVKYGGILSPEELSQGRLPQSLFVNAKMSDYYYFTIIPTTTTIIISANQKRFISKTVNNGGC